MKKQSFIIGALIISVGGIVAKVLGAFYRIPLANFLGGQGMGIYQMVYPLYCLLLTVSATGIPSGLARLVAQAETSGKSSVAVLRRSLILFSVIGLAGSALMYLLAPLMSAVQGERLALSSYRMLAPSVFFVSVISCFRGYFQGKSNFLPTALSEIFEQIVKIALGLWFAVRFASDPVKGVSYTLLAVTVSEVATALGMAVFFFFSDRKKNKPLFSEERGNLSVLSLLSVTLPVTLAAGILPLSAILDSIIIVNFLPAGEVSATSLYGLFSGGALTLVNLPVSVCYGLAAASVPLISSLFTSGKVAEGEKKSVFALKCTFFIAIPAAFFLFLFSGEVSALLFPSVGGREGEILAGLVKILSVTAVLLAATQTLSACLTGKGKAKIAAISMACAVAVKLAAEFFLVRIPSVGIFGAAIAAICCYFVAFAVDLVYIIRDKNNFKRIAVQFFAFFAAALVAAGTAYLIPFDGAVLHLAVTCAVYLAVCFGCRLITLQELGLFRRKYNDNRSRVGMLPLRSFGRR